MATDTKTVPEWSEVFRIGRLQAYGDLEPATTETIQDELDFVDVAQDLKTPSRKEWGITKKEAGKATSPPFLSDRDLEMRHTWHEDTFMPTGIVDHIEKMGDAMNDVFAQKDHQGKTGAERYACVAEDLTKIQAWQLKADARIGQPVEICGREFAGLWEALSYSVQQAEDKTADEIRLLKAMIKAEEVKELELKERVNAWTIDVSTSFLNVKSHCDAVVEELRQVKEELDGKQTAVPGDGALPAGAGRIQNGVLFSPRRNPEDQPTPDYEDLLKEMNSLRTRLTRVEVARMAGNGGGSDGPPSFGGLGLTCIVDLASWNIERGLSHYFGLFHDANSLLTFKRTDYTDAFDHVATLKRAQDVGLNMIQAKLLVSFQNQVPLFFGKGAITKGSSLNALRTARDWEEDDGTSGAKYDLERALPNIERQLQSYIDVYLRDGQHEAWALATRCLSHSLLFIIKLSDFITRTYRAMMLLGYNGSKAWIFLMRQVKRIWEDMARARACCVDIGSPTDPKEVGGGVFKNHNAALAIWGVLKAHDVMQEFICHNFEDHPSIAAEQVRWVTRNVMGGENVDSGSGDKAMESRVSKLEKAGIALKIQVDEDTSRLDGLEGRS
jgi:hypothetical protein